MDTDERLGMIRTELIIREGVEWDVGMATT